ncbi:MAG: hypothetical protein KTR24_04825, partial [Saprospiraceae bacterium]|nr:hypothetical protein [Saprospiraceae bacterium]
MNSPVLLLKRTLLGSTAPPLVCLFLAGFGFLSALHAQHTPVVQWDFSHDGMMLESTGQFPYTLIRANDLVSFKEDSTTGFLEIKEGGYLFIPRAACPALDFHGTNSSFTIVARIKRRQKSYEQCEAIAGMWNETRKKRQYYLFLNLLQKESGDQVCGHVSTV